MGGLHATLFFLILFILRFGVSPLFPQLSDIGNILLFGLLPSLAVFFKKKRLFTPQTIGLGPVKSSTIGYAVLFTFAVYPVTAFLLDLINAVFSVAHPPSGITGAESPFALFLSMVILGPVVEELIYRGILYNGYRRDSNTILAVILSALAFGIMHGNLYQTLYGTFFGIFLALIMLVSNSLLACMIIHVLHNGISFTLYCLELDPFAGLSLYGNAILALIGFSLCVLILKNIRKSETHPIN